MKLRILNLLVLFSSIFTTAISTAMNSGITQVKTYIANSSLQQNNARTLIEEIPFIGTEKVLDIGCGNGEHTKTLAMRVPHGKVVGIDISPSMIASAKKTYLNVDNLSFIDEDILDFSSHQKFDVAFSSNVLHWVVEQEKALKNIYKALKPGGRAYIAIPGKSVSNTAIRSEEIANTKTWASYFPNWKTERYYPDRKEYINLLQREGFTILESKEEQYTWNFKNKKMLETWLEPLLNYTQHLDDQKKRKFTKDVAEQMILKSYLEGIVNEKEEIKIPFRNLTFVVQKTY